MRRAEPGRHAANAAISAPIAVRRTSTDQGSPKADRVDSCATRVVSPLARGSRRRGTWRVVPRLRIRREIRACSTRWCAITSRRSGRRRLTFTNETACRRGRAARRITDLLKTTLIVPIVFAIGQSLRAHLYETRGFGAAQSHHTHEVEQYRNRKNQCHADRVATRGSGIDQPNIGNHGRNWDKRSAGNEKRFFSTRVRCACAIARLQWRRECTEQTR